METPKKPKEDPLPDPYNHKGREKLRYLRAYNAGETLPTNISRAKQGVAKPIHKRQNYYQKKKAKKVIDPRKRRSTERLLTVTADRRLG